jgi:hypothetical protein
VHVSPRELGQLESAPNENKGEISKDLRQRIKDLVQQHGILPGRQEKLVLRLL